VTLFFCGHPPLPGTSQWGERCVREGDFQAICISRGWDLVCVGVNPPLSPHWEIPGRGGWSKKNYRAIFHRRIRSWPQKYDSILYRWSARSFSDFQLYVGMCVCMVKVQNFSLSPQWWATWQGWGREKKCTRVKFYVKFDSAIRNCLKRKKPVSFGDFSIFMDFHGFSGKFSERGIWLYLTPMVGSTKKNIEFFSRRLYGVGWPKKIHRNGAQRS